MQVLIFCIIDISILLLLFFSFIGLHFFIKFRWYWQGLSYVNQYCRKYIYKVRSELIIHYKKVSKIFLIVSSICFAYFVKNIIHNAITFFQDKEKFIFWFWTLNNVLIFVPFYCWIWIFSIVLLKRQIKWEKINNKIDDKHLIEKSIDINTNEKQLYISYKQYKFQVLLKIFFKNYLPKNFHKLPFEKQQFIIYMNIVLNYEKNTANFW